MSKLTGLVAVVSGKGGVGKTTSTQAVAGALKLLGETPDFLLDMDYGASLTRSYGYTPSEPVAEALLNRKIEVPDAINETDEGIMLVPTTPDIAHTSIDKTSPWRQRLRELAQEYLIVADTSDDVMSAPVAATILAADILLVPVMLDEKTYRRTFPEIGGLLAGAKHEPEVMWFVTRAERETQYSRHIEKLIADDGVELLVKIPSGVAAKEADSKSVSVVGYAPSASVSKKYRELAQLVYARLRSVRGGVPAAAPERKARPIAVAS